MGQPLGQVDAVRADPGGQGRVLADEQEQAAPARDGQQPPRPGLGVRGAEVTEDDPRAARQAPGDGLGIGRARRVGEEQEGRQGLPQPPARR